MNWRSWWGRRVPVASGEEVRATAEVEFRELIVSGSNTAWGVDIKGVWWDHVSTGSDVDYIL